MMWLLIVSCASSEDVVVEECSPLYYENFGRGFLTENCQGCHAQHSTDREGAPDNIYFDNEESVLLWRESIVQEIEAETMPPAGGLTPELRSAALEWLSCMEEQ